MTSWAMIHPRLVLVFAVLVGVQARADKLDAEVTKKIPLDETWAVQEFDGPGHFYWTWNSDGTLCLRLHEETGDCDDTGFTLFKSAVSQ